MTKYEADKLLHNKLLQFQHNPYDFVMHAFPWGVKNSQLHDKKGPRKWQKEILIELGCDLKNGEINDYKAIRKAVASGHGIGKSALVAWVILWAMSTKAMTKGVVTANTENQLKTKTWAEVAKWYSMMLNKHQFHLTATALYAAGSDDMQRTWRFDMVPWSERNTEAFAGLHNESRRILLIFDEASAIDDKIWEVSEGALTDEKTEMLWLTFGNPTKNTGRFRECFRRFRERWSTKSIDSRTVEGTNKKQIDEWARDYGEDSDFFKVRVKGEFPSMSNMQFISSALVDDAMNREPFHFPDDPLIMSIDVARGGDDKCVIRFRRGLHGYVIKPESIDGRKAKDSMQFAAHISMVAQKNKPDHILIDATGVGGPVGDRLRQLGYNCIDINFASKSPDSKYANMRAYMYAKLEEWLRSGGALENDRDLHLELTSVEYSHNMRDQVLLMPKDKLKEIIGVSPDNADALAMSFAISFGQTESRSYIEMSNNNFYELNNNYEPFNN